MPGLAAFPEYLFSLLEYGQIEGGMKFQGGSVHLLVGVPFQIELIGHEQNAGGSFDEDLIAPEALHGGEHQAHVDVVVKGKGATLEFAFAVVL